MTSKRRSGNKKKKHSPSRAYFLYTNMAADSLGTSARPNPQALKEDPVITSTPITSVSPNKVDINDSSSFHEESEYTDDKHSEFLNAANKSKSPGTSVHSIDNDSLLNALRLQNDSNLAALYNMVSTTISGAIFQLKTELSTEFKQALEKQHNELITLKQSNTEQLSKFDLKFSTNIGEINTRVNTINDKIDKFENIMKKSNIQKVDGLLSENSTKVSELSVQYKSLSEKIQSCERKDRELVEALTFLGKEIDEIKTNLSNNNTDRLRITNRCDINEIGQSRLSNRVDNLEVKALSSDTRHRKLNLIF